MHRVLVAAILLLIAPSCRPGPPEGDGTLDVSWTGPSTGRFVARAEGRWCVSDTLLEVLAVRNDTAAGIALIAQDSAGAARYPVNEVRTWTPGRPQANVGLRLLSPLEIKSYDGMSGTVIVTSGDSRAVSGTLDVRIRPMTGTDTLHLVGRFTRIPIVPAAPPCGRANRPGQG